MACKGLGWRGSPATLCIQVATVSEVLDLSNIEEQFVETSKKAEIIYQTSDQPLQTNRTRSDSQKVNLKRHHDLLTTGADLENSAGGFLS